MLTTQTFRRYRFIGWKILLLSCILGSVRGIPAQLIPEQPKILVYQIDGTCLDTVLLTFRSDLVILDHNEASPCIAATGFEGYLWANGCVFEQRGAHLSARYGIHSDLLAVLDSTQLHRQWMHQEFRVTLLRYASNVTAQLPYYEMKLVRTFGPRDKIWIRWNADVGILRFAATIRGSLKRHIAELVYVNGKPVGALE